MEKKSGGIRTVLLMTAAALFVVALIYAATDYFTRSSNRSEIVLPQAGAELPPAENSAGPGEGFVAVTVSNAAQVVASLERPEAYTQTLYRRTMSGGLESVSVVTVWERDGIHRLTLSDSGQLCHILTDGSLLWLWYEDSPEELRSVKLPEGVTADDLSGVFTYESILSYGEKDLIRAEYTQLSTHGNTPCLYVVADEKNGEETHYWVDLTTGLLCCAESRLSGNVTYELYQKELVLLDPTDAELAQQMCLPDGTEAFPTAAAGTQQG